MAVKIVSDLNALLSNKKSTLPDIIKGFHQYVKTNENGIASNISIVLNEFRPTTNLGKQLRIKLVDKYQVREEVLQLLKSGDSLNVNQALKCTWYFTDISDPVVFVNDFIPCLSLSTRLKVLNRCSSLLKNSKGAEIIYEGVKSRYGTRTAVSVLPACSENFIRNELPNIKITLSPGIVLSLFKKYPSLTTEYIKYLAEDPRKRKNLSSYETVLVKLASKDLETFLELTGKHKSSLPSIKLGRRPTKKFLKTHTAEFLNNYQNYKWLLKDKILFSRLSLEQIKRLYVTDLLPSNLSEFLCGARMAQNTLSLIKPVVHSEVVLTTFKTKYGREMTGDDILYNLEENWVKYLPAETRVRWLESKIKENVSDPEIQAKYIAQLPVDKSMPKLKQLIESQSNANVRAGIAVKMVETLEINRYSPGIKDLFAYFVRRFRNETSRFRSGIIQGMTSLHKLLLDMEPNGWVPIIEFINIMKLNHEVYNDYCIENALLKIFDFRVQNSLMKNGNVDECLKDYLDLATGDNKSCNHEYLKLCENTPYRSFCLQWLLNVVPQMKWVDVNFAKGFHARLYQHLITFNQKNPHSLIPCPEWLSDSINKIVDDEETSLRVLDTIRRTTKIADLEMWRSIVKRTALRYLNCETLCELLKFEPVFIFENIIKIMEKTMGCTLEGYSIFYKKTRLFDLFGIPSEIAKICRITLKLENAEFDLDEESNLASESSQPHAIGALSIILPSSDFLKVALNFAPTASKVEDYSKETQALHDIQKAIGKSFVNVTSAVEVLPVLQMFAVGDYLKFVSGSLIAVCVRVPENKILPMLKDCMDCPVSLRKHYLKLMYRIAPTEERVQIFVNIFKTEKNISLRLVLFQLLRKAFIDEPDDDTYRTFKSILTQLTEEDQEALKELFHIDQIEDDFVGRYMELIWELVGSQWSTVLPKGKSDIVSLVSCHVIKLLSEEFCGKLLSHVLSETLPNTCPSEYLSLYLILAPSNDSQAARLANVMASVQPLIKSCWDEYKFTSGHVFPVRHVVSELVRSLCRDAPHHLNCSTVHPVQLLENVKQTLAKLIKPSQFLRESLELDLAVKVLQHKRSNLPESALTSSVVDLYKSYLQTYNLYLYPLIKCLVECAPNAIQSDLALALTSDGNSTCQLIGIQLLSSNLSKEQDVPTYKSLIETLSTIDDPVVQAMADDFFSSLTSSII